MITVLKLKEICDKYGISYEKLIDKNENILEYGEDNEITNTLEFLIKEMKVEPKNIEKCPSVLWYGTTKNVKTNYKFLQSQNITKSNIKNTLSILNPEPVELRNTYDYIEKNYGINCVLISKQVY